MPVRPGTDQDASEAASLVRQVLREHDLPFEPWGLDADILAPGAAYAVFYVATDAVGRIVGTAALRRTGPASGELRKMFLLPEARGNALGRALLEAVLAAARARRLEWLTLTTRSRYDRAIRMYERAGFRLLGPARRPRGDDLGLVYELDLAGRDDPARPAGLPRRPNDLILERRSRLRGARRFGFPLAQAIQARHRSREAVGHMTGTPAA